MASDLTIGRVGLSLDLFNPAAISERTSGRGRSIQIRGHVKDTTGLAQANHLRNQLLAQVQSERSTGLVAVISTGDPELNGFYILTAASLEGSHSLGSFIGTGFFPYSVTLEQLETVVFASGLTGGVLPNDHSTVTGDPFVCPPFNATSFTPDGVEFTRVSQAGTVALFRSVDETDEVFWSVAPANYYLAAAELFVGAAVLALQSGYEIPDTPNNFIVRNGMIQVTGNTSGEVAMAVSNGTVYESNLVFKFQNGGSNVGAWDHIVVLRNDPEEVSIRLIQGRANTARGRLTLDISLRRGARHATFFFTSTTSQLLKVTRTPNDAGTTVGSHSIRDSANDGDGNRWVVGSLSTTTKDTTTGGLSRTNTTLDFYIGYELNGSTAASGDAAADLYLQYIHHLAERVIPAVAQGVVV